MMTEDTTIRNPHREMKFDPYTGEPLAHKGKHAARIIEEDPPVEVENAPSAVVTEDDQYADAGDYPRTAADDVIDCLTDGFRSAKKSISNGFKRMKRGYDDRDLCDLGFSTVSLLIEVLPRTHEYRNDPKLQEAVPVFEDYLTWRARGLWKVSRSIGYDTVDGIEETVQKRFMKSWDYVWNALAKTPAYNVTSTKSKLKGEYRIGKGVRFAWQRLVLGYDEWQIDNIGYSIPNRLSVLLVEYAKSVHGYPQDYPETPKLQGGNEDWEEQTWFSDFLGNAEKEDDPETNAEMGLPYVAWARDCLVAAQAMEIAASMKDAASPVSRAVGGYGTNQQRKEIQDRCREAWYWIGWHIADLWD